MKKQAENKIDAAAQAGKANNNLNLELRHENDTEEAAKAAALTEPAIMSAITIHQLDTQLSINALVTELTSRADAVNAGQMKRPEAMLLAQAETLEALFHSLVRRALVQDRLPQYEAHMRLALKAQSQCRTTLEALAEMKNPRAVAFVKQANIAAGHQQVNNGDTRHVRAGARTRENEIPQNKLFTETRYEALDTRGTLTASRIDPSMATVEAVNRATDEGR